MVPGRVAGADSGFRTKMRATPATATIIAEILRPAKNAGLRMTVGGGRQCIADESVCRSPSALYFFRLFFSHALAHFELHLAGFLVGIDHDVIAVQNLAVKNLQRQRIL